MTISTVATSTAASAMLAAPFADNQPQYAYAGEGRWLPANQAAHDECARWNRYADTMNARTAARSLRRHDH